MTPSERRATLVLALILILRMTALFMVLPVLAPYAQALVGHPHWAIGVAVGAYGLTQALLQIPLGWLSDRVGRKPVIAGGLAVFALGSLLAGLAADIHTLILARLLQGMGAIAAASTALLADMTRESVRTTAMAIIGAGIGGAFLLALMLGPGLLAWFEVPALFYLSAAGAVLAMLLLLALPAEPSRSAAMAGGEGVLSRALVSLDLGVFALHAMLASVFVGLPLMLESAWDWPLQTHWRLYLPVMAASLVPVFPLIRQVESRQWGAVALPVCVVLLIVSLLAMGTGWLWLPIALWLFFCAFNFLEASLPSLTAKLAPASARGRAMGLFASAQFLGAFVGAVSGGLVLSHAGPEWVLASSSAWAVAWLTLLCVRNPAVNTFKPTVLTVPRR